MNERIKKSCFALTHNIGNILMCGAIGLDENSGPHARKHILISI
jgi:hypothetical protein